MPNLRPSRFRSSAPRSLKREAFCLLLLVPLVFLVLMSVVSLVLTVSGFFPPPSPSSLAQNVKELPWLFLAANGTLRSRCVDYSGGHWRFSGNNYPDYFLAAVDFNRVFGKDRFGITPYECKQWIEYILYAGVEHIFWYDTAHSNAETQRPYLEIYIKAGLLSYHRFHQLFPGNIGEGFHFEQDNSYRHFLTKFKGKAKWIVEMDVDEYPFCCSDRESCFLQRFLKEFEGNKPNVTQILLQCMTFAGNPKGDLENGWVIERYQRRMCETLDMDTGYLSRQKPIFRSDLCKEFIESNPHVVLMKEGMTEVAGEERIRMNHYWGARETNFAPDTPEVIEMLVPDSSIQAIATQIKQATGLVKREEDRIGVLLRWMART